MIPPAGFLFVGPYVVPKPPVPLMSRIQVAASDHFGIPVSDILARRRGTLDIIRARQVAMLVSRKLTRKSHYVIGQKFGGRDHTTVRSQIQQAAGREESDPDFAADVAAVASRFGGA